MHRTHVPQRLALLIAATALLFAPASRAAEPCGICDREIVTNSDLATCFLESYGEFAKRGERAVAVDLSDCTSRSVVEALPSPTGLLREPNLRFLLSHPQLDCLKRKLEEPGLVLDPVVTIELDSCG